jgi:hypothetical protein
MMIVLRAALPALLALTVPAAARPACHVASVEQLGRAFADAFAGRAIASLAPHLPNRPVSLVIEHSLDDRIERLTVRLRSLDAQIARLDRAAGRQEPRGRQSLEGMACTAAACRFGPSGILHNNLYLKELGITRQGGCLTVSRIHLLDGD